MLDPDFLLLENLMHEKLLTDSERQNVEYPKSLQDRNDTLIKFVLDKIHKDETVHIRFARSLSDTDQEHVCNFISHNGGKIFS